MDPHFQQPPPQYSQLQQHRQPQPPPVEVNEMEPTIPQGVIQYLVWQGPQSRTTRAQARDAVNTNTVQSSMMPQTRAPPSSQGHSNGNVTSDPEGNGRDRLPECDPADYVMNCIYENRPLSLNDIARPVFVNHYYAGELLIPVTSKKLIRLDECDIATEVSARNIQLQGRSHKSVEALQDLLRMPMATGKNVGSILLPLEKGQGQQRGIHSQLVEPSRHLLGTLNVGKS